MWDQLAAQHRTQVLAATVAAALGAQVELPDEFELRRQFDEALVAKPERQDLDPDQQVLMKALGLGGPTRRRRP